MTALLDVKRIIWEKLVEDFATYNVDISIKRAYPKTIEVLKDKPCISIARVSGAEEIMMVSDLISESFIGSDNLYTTTSGYLNQEIYEISIWSLSSDIRDDLMILTRQIMFEDRLYFNNTGFQKLILVGCSDEEIDVSKVPAIIYRGVLRYLIMSKVMKQVAEEMVADVIPNLALYTQGGLE
jgi:hypothetical protein